MRLLFIFLLSFLFLNCTRNEKQNDTDNRNLIIDYTTDIIKDTEELDNYETETLVLIQNIQNIQPQTPGFPSANDEYFIQSIDYNFIGVYLPIEYIDLLYSTRNHSISLQSTDGPYQYRSHDVLAVFEDRIFSDLMWHDRYAISAVEGDLFQFLYEDDENIIIDNNGHLYKKIGDEPAQYSEITRNYITNIVLSDLLNNHIDVILNNRVIVFPFLYTLLGENTFFISINETFVEKGFNLLFLSTTLQERILMGLIIENNEYQFYRLENISNEWPDYRITEHIFTYIIE